MKHLRLFTLFVATMVVALSCQKEYSLEDGSTPAAGTLKADAFSNCLPSQVIGNYKVDSALTAANYIEVQVNFTVPGSYNILSDTINGYSFRGSGQVPVPGLQTVKLLGAGKPIASGLNYFAIKYDTSICYIEVTVTGTLIPAGYTLGLSAGNCTGVVLNGTYQALVPANASNTAQVDVNVSSIGSYFIGTNQVNGVTFSKFGTFTTTGPQKVTLTANGTPAAPGNSVYTITGQTNNCNFSVTYGAAPPPAAYSLQGNPGACTAAAVNGTYAAGSAMGANNTVTIQANVTSAGLYSVTTTAVNGMTFSATGAFAGTGVQPIVLKGTGTPVASGNFTFNPTGTGPGCTFSVTVGAASNDFITCKIDGVFTTFNVNTNATIDQTGGFPALLIDGSATTSFMPGVSLVLAKAVGGPITAATYTVNQAASGIGLTFNYRDAGGVDYMAITNPTLTQNPAFTVVITSITAAKVVGTFTGPLKNNNGMGPGIRNITEGKFDLTF